MPIGTARRGSGTPRFYGYFLEHFHRPVYGGIYDPGSPLAGQHGLREDVLDAVRRQERRLSQAGGNETVNPS